jgi:hypothetical protein
VQLLFAVLQSAFVEQQSCPLFLSALVVSHKVECHLLSPWIIPEKGRLFFEVDPILRLILVNSFRHHDFAIISQSDPSLTIVT